MCCIVAHPFVRSSSGEKATALQLMRDVRHAGQVFHLATDSLHKLFVSQGTRGMVFKSLVLEYMHLLLRLRCAVPAVVAGKILTSQDSTVVENMVDIVLYQAVFFACGLCRSSGNCCCLVTGSRAISPSAAPARCQGALSSSSQRSCAGCHSRSPEEVWAEAPHPTYRGGQD